MATKSETKKNDLNIVEKMYFCFFIILPFIYTEKTIDPVLIPRQIYLTCFVLLILLLLFISGLKKNSKADFSFLRLLLPIMLFAFLLVNVISFTQSTAVTESIYILSKYSVEIVFFVLTIFVPPDSPRIRYLTLLQSVALKIDKHGTASLFPPFQANFKSQGGNDVSLLC